MPSDAALPAGRRPTDVIFTEQPPERPLSILRRLGPGLIIAASIVGSGELIATTKAGADAGYSLLWLILIGCVIKVFVQVELGRFTISEGRGTIDAIDQMPGPRLRVSWLVWCWLISHVTSAVFQLGGILGGVGQALAMSLPITGDFVNNLDAGSSVYTYDDVYWSAIVAVITSVLLVNGRYGVIQVAATGMVAAFTMVTIFNLGALPYFSDVKIGWPEIRSGLSFQLPGAGWQAVSTALAAFGIIGVGASELIAYPYWCLEKGYARFTGPRDNSPQWAERARGWMRVMRWDCACSLVIYTFATLCFYILGAAVLHPAGLSPSGNAMISTLAQMYDAVFYPWGDWVFLFGAIAVLYSTVFVATAGNTRVSADAIRVFRFGAFTEESRQWWVRFLCAIMPIVNLLVYLVSKSPVKLILLAGFTQATLLPLLGGAALYYRYARCDRRITPGILWDAMLWLSVLGLLVAGMTGAVGRLGELVRALSG